TWAYSSQHHKGTATHRQENTHGSGWKGSSEFEEDRKLYFVHMGAEILARTIGRFQSGYLYEALDQNDPRIQSALAFATQCILRPAKDNAFGPFFAT
ncbi:MAG: hypothetical protein AAFQ87_26560, partial [Bacteroidota bacterium]